MKCLARLFFLAAAILVFSLVFMLDRNASAQRNAGPDKSEAIRGTLQVVAECDEFTGRTLYFADVGKERIKLKFDGQPSEDLRTGMTVSMRGTRRKGEFDVAKDSLKVETTSETYGAAEAGASTSGEQRLLVLLVNFQNDQRQPYTIQQSNDLMFNPAYSSSATNFYNEVSYGQMWLAGTTAGWLTMAMNASCDYTQIASKAKQAAQAAGVNLSLYERFMYVFPAQSNCGWSGLGYVGGVETWINGSLKLRTAAHELGHNLGLRHSRALSCPGSVTGTNCTSSEYGHMVDMMGSGTGHFHAYQKDRLGWLNSATTSPVVTASSSGTYTLTTFGVNSPSTKGLRILKSVDSFGRRSWYYLELRKPVGFDSYMSTYYNSNLAKGVMVTQNSESDARENYQLDMNPATTTFNDSALAVGQSYSDLNAGFTITTLSISDTEAVVRVTFGAEPDPAPSPTPSPSPSPTPECIRANPSVLVSPADTQLMAAGGSLNYSISVVNNNSAGCGASGFALQSSVPGGWNTSSPTPTLSLASGASATATIQITSAADAAGTYTVGLGVAAAGDPSYASAVSREISVYALLGVEAATDRAAYSTGEIVRVSAAVSANGHPVAGVNVSFVIRKPNGRLASATATTGADGNAAYTYRLNKKQDPRGLYRVSADAVFNAVPGSGATTFEVR